ncbi:hypothetical protein PMAYCL1PPCAC_18869, partial [Pristionchus mayeri]
DDDDDKDVEDGNYKNGFFYDEKATDEKVSKTDVRMDDVAGEGKKKKEKGRHSDEHDAPPGGGGRSKRRPKIVSPEAVIGEVGGAPGADVEPEGAGADGTSGTGAEDTKGDGTGNTGTSGTEQRKGKGKKEKLPAVSPAKSPNVKTAQENSAREKAISGLAGRIAQEKLNVDSLIRRVLSCAMPGHGLTKNVPMAEIMSLIRVARYAFA